VALDAMGVIYEQQGVSGLLAAFAGRPGVPLDSAMAKDLYRSASLGKMSSADLWEALGIPGPERDAEFLAGRLLMPGVRDFLAPMEREGIRVGCITNDVAEWSLSQRRRYGLQDRIAPWVVSGEVASGSQPPRSTSGSSPRQGATQGTACSSTTPLRTSTPPQTSGSIRSGSREASPTSRT
jgi:hypothetical protein